MLVNVKDLLYDHAPLNFGENSSDHTVVGKLHACTGGPTLGSCATLHWAEATWPRLRFAFLQGKVRQETVGSGFVDR